MRKLVSIYIVYLILHAYPSLAAQKKFEDAPIMHKEKSSHSWEARVTIRVPESIPLRWWANCNYYDIAGKLIASTRHVLNERVPTWTVKADYEFIDHVKCMAK